MNIPKFNLGEVVSSVRSVLPFGKAGQEGILVIHLGGVIGYDDDEDSDFGRLCEILDELFVRLPKAVVMRVNCPGGSIAASQEIFARIKSLRDQGVKIVAMMEDGVMSGGVYVCMAADKIVAHPGTVTGSIGVIFRGYEYSEILKFLKIRDITIKSVPYKDIRSDKRRMSQKERNLLQRLVLDAHDQFCQTIATSRNIEIDTVKKFADGRIFTGNQAKDYGLIDEVGSFYDAIHLAGELAGIPEAERTHSVLRHNKSTIFSKLREALPFSRLESSFSGLPLWLMKR